MESRVIQIRQTLYVRIPAAQAKRLGLKAGQHVDVQVQRLFPHVKDIVQDLRGRRKGAFGHVDRRKLWGELD
jgi:antitoxin component of MazEF toxin-antitoxin module